MLAASLILTGCQDSEREAGGARYPSGPVTMTAGANPGSGLDITIRSVVESLQDENIVEVALPVENRPGAAGADFLATMVEQYKGQDDQVSATSLSMMMNELRGKSKYGYDDVTMIARLMTEYFVVVTGPGSPFENLDDVMAEIKADPGRVTVGAATDDEAPFDLLVSAAGGDPSSINYVPWRVAVTRSPRLARATSALRSAVSARSSLRCNRETSPRLGCWPKNGYPALTLPLPGNRDSMSPSRTGEASTGRRICRSSPLRTGRRCSARWWSHPPGSRSRSEASSPPPS